MAAKSRIRVREATPADVDTLVDVYFEAFQDNVMDRLMYPNRGSADSRQKVGARFFPKRAPDGDADPKTKNEESLIYVAEYLPEDASTESPGEIIAFAKWALQREPLTEEEWKKDDFNATTETWGEDCNVAVVNAFIGDMNRVQREHAKGESALYLSLLACRPTRQRLGAGAALVQRGVDLADGLGLPTRLEASPVGYGLYRKYGFEDVDVSDIKVTETWGVANTLGENWGSNNASALAGPTPDGVMRTVIMRRPPKKATA